jgi:hypothetical protein
MLSGRGGGGLALVPPLIIQSVLYSPNISLYKTSFPKAHYNIEYSSFEITTIKEPLPAEVCLYSRKDLSVRADVPFPSSLRKPRSGALPL